MCYCPGGFIWDKTQVQIIKPDFLLLNFYFLLASENHFTAKRKRSPYDDPFQKNHTLT